ncbi:hypothetical protein NHP190012_10160 [Helicobacter sp. NHP19-012]|uniref:Uncharacterized protein n=1 Tax=Helicobacter gastrofelis TaxID=2849642 RepID=A0ABM7SEZ3_9HELI|nr:hypothetical protein [Helicobacter sp. NHP19-012]BCZ19374.1 hypothetical protein NHP190012_10160 [Helicobacter sp. NHP19-012]
MRCLARVDLDLVNGESDQESQTFTLGNDEYTLILQRLKKGYYVSAQVFRREIIGMYSVSCLARVDLDGSYAYTEQQDFSPNNYSVDKLTLFVQNTIGNQVSAQVLSHKEE